MTLIQEWVISTVVCYRANFNPCGLMQDGVLVVSIHITNSIARGLLGISTGAWGMDFVSSSPLFSTTPPSFFQNFHINHSFFKIFIIIRFFFIWQYQILYQSKNCGHRIHVLFMMYDVYWYCQMKKKRKFWKRNDLYENFEKRGEEETKSMPHAPVGISYT